MLIRLIAVGTKMPVWVNEGFREYSRRLSGDVRLELVEVPLGAGRGKNPDIAKAMAAETKDLLAALGKSDWVVALDVRGQEWDTPGLAERLTQWKMRGTDVALLVGGPEGLAPQCLELARQRWSLSRLTFPHPLVRVLVAEQIYRAWSLLSNHPYHR